MWKRLQFTHLSSFLPPSVDKPKQSWSVKPAKTSKLWLSGFQRKLWQPQKQMRKKWPAIDQPVHSLPLPFSPPSCCQGPVCSCNSATCNCPRCQGLRTAPQSACDMCKAHFNESGKCTCDSATCQCGKACTCCKAWIEDVFSSSLPILRDPDSLFLSEILCIQSFI